jgi:hypothetical protein
MWVRQYCRPSGEGLSVTNLDYVFEDFRHKRLMLVEEKQNGGHLVRGQAETFAVLDGAFCRVAPELGYTYAGLYVLQFPRGATMPGPGMTLNNRRITAEELQAHLNFASRFCEPWILHRD